MAGELKSIHSLNAEERKCRNSMSEMNMMQYELLNVWMNRKEKKIIEFLKN